MENFLAGHRETALPAAMASGLMFLAWLALYVFVERLDREASFAESLRSGCREMLRPPRRAQHDTE